MYKTVLGSLWLCERPSASSRCGEGADESICHWQHGRRAYRLHRAWRAKHQWRMHVDVECVRLHAGSWFVEDDFGQSSMRAGPSVSCFPYFKACAEWKPATTRAWGSRGTGVGYLHPRQFVCCLAFCPRGQHCRWRVLVEWYYRSDRG